MSIRIRRGWVDWLSWGCLWQKGGNKGQDEDEEAEEQVQPAGGHAAGMSGDGDHVSGRRCETLFTRLNLKNLEVHVSSFGEPDDLATIIVRVPVGGALARARSGQSFRLLSR